MSEQRNDEGLLSGCRVLDLTDEKGLLCGKVLGDFGADVIKIERPGGDPARNIGPFYNDTPQPDKSLFWFYTNLNKRSITLNLKTSDGREVFKRLVKTSHFVIESFEPGYMASLGLGYPDLERINPALIMTSITPFGQTGPYSHYQATDIVVMALGGIMRLYGEPDRPPVRISQPQAFFLGSVHAAMGSIIAHYYRGSTGEGQHVDVSCQQAVVLALMMMSEYWDVLKYNYRRQGTATAVARPLPLGPLIRQWVYPAKDGYILAMLSGGAQAGMVASSQALVRAANRDGYALEIKDFDWTKLDYGTTPQPVMNRVQDALRPFFLAKAKAELLREAVEQSILLITISDPRDVAESPQLAAREFFVRVEHPELGHSITYPGFPVQMSQASQRVQRRAPLVGEHNEEVYLTELGMSREGLVLLKSRGVI